MRSRHIKLLIESIINKIEFISKNNNKEVNNVFIDIHYESLKHGDSNSIKPRIIIKFSIGSK